LDWSFAVANGWRMPLHLHFWAKAGNTS